MKRKLNGDHCLCRTCNEHFNSTAAFHKHRVGSFTDQPPDYGRRCLTVEEMLAAGMSKSSSDWWLTGQADHSSVARRRDRQKSAGEEGSDPARPVEPVRRPAS